MRKIIGLVLFIAFAFVVTVSAQTKKGDKVPGYIIDKAGKRIEGSIIVGDWATNQLKVKFVKRGNSKKVYKPNQLKGYGFQQTLVDCTGGKEQRWVEYDTRKADRPSTLFGPTTVFMEKEVNKGHFKLYCYYIEVRNNPKKPYTYSFFVEDANGKFQKVDEKNFSNVSRKLFGEYRALSSRIGKKDFKFQNMDRMIADYNYWVSNQHNTNEYRVALKE